MDTPPVDDEITAVSKVVSSDPPPNAQVAEGSGIASTTSLTSVTDLHRSKIPPDDPRLKLDRPRSRTLRSGPAIAVAVVLLGVVAIALVASSPSAQPAADLKGEEGAPEVSTNNAVTLPDVLREPEKDMPHDPVPAPASGSPPEPVPISDARVGGPSPAAQQAETFRQARFEEFTRARAASIFPTVDDTAAAEPPTQDPAYRHPDAPANAGSTTEATPRTQGSPAESTHPVDQNMQEHKVDFLARAGADPGDYLEAAITKPRSPYEVKAGTVIPTVLVTGINSDLPGQVIGQVRENVYDTVTGNYLLIPQGSRVLATYDSMVAWGHERVLVCWNRVVRPDGSAINLGCQPGVDLAGHAGFADDVDNHWWKIVSGAVFSSLLAATAARSQGDVTTFQPSFPQVWASGAAGQINQVGQQVTSKNLQIQPTITIRPGFSVNVLVSKDIVLSPYAP